MRYTTRIGIDVGFGYTKLAYPDTDGQLHTLSFPSILGRAEDRVAALNVGLGGRRARVQRIEYDGQAYFVGQGALIESRLTGERQDAQRIGSVEERVLMLAALARAGIDEALVVTGLPVLWWDRRRQLVRSWIGEHHVTVNGRPRTITIKEVRPVWQPLGSFYSYALDHAGRAILAEDLLLHAGFAVIDIGTNTTDLSGLIELQPVARLSGGVRIGVRDVLEIISASIEREYGVRRSLAELSEALESGGSIRIFQDEISLNGLATSATESLAQEIVSAASRQWGQGDLFHVILVSGGGAVLVGKAIKAAFPRNAEVLPRSALANAIGFYNYAQRRVFKADRG